MNPYMYKEVYFGDYCKSCKFYKLKEEEEPCDECLSIPMNLYSHKPAKWEQSEKKASVAKDE